MPQPENGNKSRLGIYLPTLYTPAVTMVSETMRYVCDENPYCYKTLTKHATSLKSKPEFGRRSMNNSLAGEMRSRRPRDDASAKRWEFLKRDLRKRRLGRPLLEWL